MTEIYLTVRGLQSSVGLLNPLVQMSEIIQPGMTAVVLVSVTFW